MKLIQSKRANINYLAQVVDLKDFTPHPNADKMKLAHIGGYTICVGINDAPGKYIYFPTNSEINPNILSALSLYRHVEKNANVEKSGFFNDNGRVTAIRLRGVASEGFLLPISGFIEFLANDFNITAEESDFESGTEFDTFEHNGKEFWINKKYVVYKHVSTNQHNRRNNKLKYFNRVDETQFSFHYDTVAVKKQPWCVRPDDLISITSKWHGTSHISAYVLCNRKMTIFRKIANILQGLSWNSVHRTYDYLYASRNVIKNQFIGKDTGGYYGVDVWKYADEILRPHMSKGMTIYAEIVGFTPDGKYIQKGYDYGCTQPDGNEYVHEKHYKVRIYRITLTNVDGVKYDFSAREVQQWCKNKGLVPVTELYYGYAYDLYPELNQLSGEEWQNEFWKKMSEDKRFYMELDSPDCLNKVPHEGVVIKVEDMIPRAWKLKTFAFTNIEQKELDSGESNIEDEN